MSRRRKRDPLMLEVVADIGRGRITIGAIHDSKRTQLVHGYMEAGSVRINQNVATVDTLVHEILHRIRPSWSEQTVRQRTAKLMRQLSVEEIDKLYEMLHGSARKAKRALAI